MFLWWYLCFMLLNMRSHIFFVWPLTKNIRFPHFVRRIFIIWKKTRIEFEACLCSAASQLMWPPHIMMEELWRLLRCKGVNGPHHQLQIVFHLWIPNACLKNTPNWISEAIMRLNVWQSSNLKKRIFCLSLGGHINVEDAEEILALNSIYVFFPLMKTRPINSVLTWSFPHFVQH